MMRKFILLFGALLSYTQGISQSVDSAVAQQVEQVVRAANQYLYTNTDTAKVLAQQALRIAEKNSYSFGIANAYNILGVVSDLNGEFAQSFFYHKEAIDLYREVDNGRGMANSQANMAVLLKQHARYEEALGYMLSSHEFYVEDHDTIRAFASLITIGNLMSELGEALEAVQATFDEALVGLRIVGDTANMCSALNAKAEAYAKYGRKIIGLRYYKEAADLARIAQRPFNLGYSYAGMARVYLDVDEPLNAIDFNQMAVQEYKKINYRFGILDLLEQRVRIHELAEDYETALRSQRAFQALKDSLFNEKQSQQISQLEIQYETEKKEAEITALSQQTAIQNLEIKQKNQGLMLGGALVIFVAVVVFLVLRQRDSKRRASQTELEHRFLRSQLNPHFIFNALVSVQTYLFKKDTEQAALYLTKFSKLMREILENSRQEFIPLEQEVSMLTNYLDLHRLRLDNQFTYDVVMDDSIHAEEETIPPMFVQPFVENAIEHGVLSLQAGGKIELVFKKQGGFIQIEVLDNGKGIESTQLKSTNHQSLATTIIRERMDLFNRSLRNKIQLAIGNRTDEAGNVLGTRVELMVPFQHI